MQAAYVQYRDEDYRLHRLLLCEECLEDQDPQWASNTTGERCDDCGVKLEKDDG